MWYTLRRWWKILGGPHPAEAGASGRSRRDSRSGLIVILSVAVGVIAASAALRGQQIGGNGKPPRPLYVVDSNFARLSSQVLLVDQERKAVIKRYPSGFHPDIAVSRDGMRLYLAYDYLTPDQKEGGLLDVIDTRTDALIARVDNPNRFLFLGPYYDSTMTFSSDGRWLYTYQARDEPNGGRYYGVAVFDTATNSFLPDVVALPVCGAAVFVPARQNSGLSVVCSDTNDVRNVLVDDKGVPVIRLPRAVPIPRHADIATAFLSGSDNELTAIMTDGNYSKIHLGTRKTLAGGALAITSNTAGPTERGTSQSAALGGKFLRFQQPQVHDGKIFVGLARRESNLQLFDEISVLDAATFEQKLSIPHTPFWSLTIGNAGSRLYTLDTLGAAIHVLETSGGSEISKIEGLGTSPTILIPPE